ncbi:MAG TPA: hypothetical protein VJ914_03555 [Pseudonocardiaceae bacterium]|nr:hypothetical protein [Pseudonocardiaceae bacterium]
MTLPLLPPLPRLSVTATMLLCIDQFVAVVDEGVLVPRSTRQVQPWLGGEALLGGALWALWTDGVIELVTGSPVEVRLCRGASYPAASLEYRLLAALSDQRESVTDLLIRALEFTGAQPWSDLVVLVRGELVAAGDAVRAPARVNGHTPRFLMPGLAAAVERLGSRWDSWWSGRETLLVAVARACHDALAARRQRFARGVLHGLSFAGQPCDHAEAAAAAARSQCPRWPRTL